MLSLSNYRAYSISPVKTHISHRNDKKNCYLRSVRYWSSEWEIYTVQQDIFMNLSVFFNSLCQHLFLIEKTFNINYYDGEERNKMMGLVDRDEEIDKNLYKALSFANNIVNFISHVLYDLQKNDGWKAANNLRGLFAFKIEEQLTEIINKECADKDYAKSLLKQMKCEKTYNHLFRTQSACVENCTNTKTEKIKVSFILDAEKQLKEKSTLQIDVDSIGNFFYSFLTKIAHQAMPNYLLPNSRKSSDYADYNILLSIICMEILLIVSQKIKKSFLFEENEIGFSDSKIFRSIVNKMDHDDQEITSFQNRIYESISNHDIFFKFHKKITTSYTNLINQYIDLLDRVWYDYESALHLKFSSIY